ncbi:MAG: pyridoxamine 5'-phosphate oxidase family protein [Prevotella sp.]|jgi:nitroimidazol reductase NimA-like FMN-containing flavoprotein (pyridoxamine 5'-phosphate oxidase superfamily)
MSNFRPMRRKHQMLSEEVSKKILTSATAGVLSVLGDEGYPYGVPMSHAYYDGKLYFHSAIQGHKVDAIRNCDKATYTVIAEDDVKPEEFTTYYKSVICFGKVRLIEDNAEKMMAIRKLCERFNPVDIEAAKHEIAKGFDHMVMIEFTIEHISGKEAKELKRSKAFLG